MMERNDSVKRRLGAKLRSRAGESIGETLVSLLIAALALTMLAGAIASATKIITQSKAKMAEYYAGDGAMVAHTVGDDATITMTNVPGQNVPADLAQLGPVSISARKYSNPSIGTVSYGPVSTNAG